MHANPHEWIWLIVSVLVVWRLSILLCYDAGPFNIVSKARIWLYKIRLGKLIDCFHCTAVWISIVVTIGLYKFSIATFFLAIAAAGGASIIEKLLYYGTKSEE